MNISQTLKRSGILSAAPAVFGAMSFAAGVYCFLHYGMQAVSHQVALTDLKMQNEAAVADRRYYKVADNKTYFKIVDNKEYYYLVADSNAY